MQSRKEPRLELVEVALETPTGRYELESTEDPGFVMVDHPWLSVRVRAPSAKVTLALFSKRPHVMVEPDPQAGSVRFDVEGGFYQRGSGPRVPLSGTPVELRVRGSDAEIFSLRLDVEPALARISLDSSMPPPATIQAIEKVQGVPLRFHVPFRIDGQQYRFDLTFVLELDRVWRFRNLTPMP